MKYLISFLIIGVFTVLIAQIMPTKIQIKKFYIENLKK